jgi:hypothetical protein
LKGITRNVCHLYNYNTYYFFTKQNNIYLKSTKNEK